MEEENGNRLPLYTSRNLRNKLLGDRQFDAAMVAYMEILCQIRDVLENQSIKMPYKIESGQIQDTSGSNEWFTVKFNFSSGDQWVSLVEKKVVALRARNIMALEAGNWGLCKPKMFDQ